ncbi:MAG: sulfatase-like hydrolase/transferase [Rubrobacteraceae bacterium]
MRKTLTRRDFLKAAGLASVAVPGGKYLTVDKPSVAPLPVGLPGDGSSPNIVLIILDSLRKDHVGVYGNEWIQTPNLDAFANESLRFTRAVPEAMPTIPARRAIYTGLRTFPFRDWIPQQGNGYTPYGWQRIPEDQVTLTETLREAGWRTMLATDVYYQFSPSMNFQRGFDVYDWVRGQQRDAYRPTWTCPEEKLSSSLLHGNYFDVEDELRQYFANTKDRTKEEDYFAPRVFTAAMNLLRMAAGEKFFLVVDSFDPHEPWDPPQKYIDLYHDGRDVGGEPLTPAYGNSDYLSEEQLERMRALYAAEVTMADEWLGRFLDYAGDLGLMENTMFIVLSDHGHALGEHGAVGKPEWALWPEIVDIPFLIHHPDGRGSGKTSDYSASTHDVAPTVLGFLDVDPSLPMDGQDLNAVLDQQEPEPRPYRTSAYNRHVWARDDDHALISLNTGEEPRLYDIRSDPEQKRDIAPERPDIASLMFQNYVVADADGPLPNYDVTVS